MRANIHPNLHAVRAHCSCGNEWDTYATVEELRLELCGACHPYYTGKKRAVSAAGRVQKFQDKYGGATAAAAAAAVAPAMAKAKAAAAEKAAAKAASKAKPVKPAKAKKV